MRARHLVVLALAAAAVTAACRKPGPKTARRPNYLLDVPFLSPSRLLDTTGTPEAQHVVLVAPAPIDSVANYYRHQLPPMGWRLLSDAGDSARVILYLVRGGLPMWIQIDAQGPQSRVSYTATGGTPGDTSSGAGAPPRAR